MVLTKSIIRQFETDQQLHGTLTALVNFTFVQATSLLKGAGVRRTHVTYDEQWLKRLSNRQRDGVITGHSSSPARKRRKK